MMRAGLRSPREASKAFNVAPKQRHVFLVRFHPNGVQSGANAIALSKMSFTVKSMDRPKVNPKTEELHQYNKKRQVYTGFKLDPVRIQFYDSADGSAFKMWQQYTKYYFGDFNGKQDGYRYDVIGKEFMGGFQYGFNATAANDGEGQFFFKYIELIHFYNTYADRYLLTNPRITMFEPDDVDYENSAISMISMSIVYENLQYYTQTRQELELDEFASGAVFDGAVPKLPTVAVDPLGGTGLALARSSAAPVTGMFSSMGGAMSQVADYRYNSFTPGGALGAFGNFAFGPGGTNSLSQMAMGNYGLGVAMNVGTNPLKAIGRSLQAAVNTAIYRGINSAVYNTMWGQASAATSGYGNAAPILTDALLASHAVNADGSVVTPNGVALVPQAYGAINARQTGTAQYGYDPGWQPASNPAAAYNNWGPVSPTSNEDGWGTAVNPQY